MENSGSDYLKQLDNHLATGNQSWLFGAGIGVNANVPLMGALTNRVFEMAQKEHKKLMNAVKDELPTTAHIEHILSHIGDYVTLAERSNKTEVVITDPFPLALLRETHAEILNSIAQTIRWGYKPQNSDEPEAVGTWDKPLVSVDVHRNFLRALLRNQAGLSDRRRPIRFFTTNYDTLLEDALALESFPYWDGFSGGAVAFRSHRYGQSEPQADKGYRAHVIKLHGSIDWYLWEDKVWRFRDGDSCPADQSKRVLIYPQLTKYLATQRDPFAAQFDLFRSAFSESNENVLAICGYSFGDDHINQEIQLAVERPDNKTTILAFFSPTDDSSNDLGILDTWRKRHWGNRLYIVTPAGLYVGDQGPFYAPEEDKPRDWWTFEGVTELLNNGAEGSVK